MESSQTRDQPYVPCIGKWILIHYATREVQVVVVVVAVVVVLILVRKNDQTMKYMLWFITQISTSAVILPPTSVSYRWLKQSPCWALSSSEQTCLAQSSLDSLDRDEKLPVTCPYGNTKAQVPHSVEHNSKETSQTQFPRSSVGALQLHATTWNYMFPMQLHVSHATTWKFAFSHCPILFWYFSQEYS